MDLNITKKSMRNENVVKIGYCGLQNLLRYQNKLGYSSGVYGWACDYYKIDDVIISTGYSPIGKEIAYELVKEYDLKAEKIIYNNSIDWKEQEKRVNKLLKEFIDKVRI